jgi:hypothetical protein
MPRKWSPETKLRWWWAALRKARHVLASRPFVAGDAVTFGPSRKPGVVDSVTLDTRRKKVFVRIRVGPHCIIRPDNVVRHR